MTPDFYTQQFVDAIDHCRRIFVDKTIECYMSAPDKVGVEASTFFEHVQHSFDCLIIKVFVETIESDLCAHARRGSFGPNACATPAEGSGQPKILG